MAKYTTTTSIMILLITLSCLLSLALCRKLDTTDLQINAATKPAATVEQSNPQVRPWPFLRPPPIPAAGGGAGFNRPWPHWEYAASPPRPAGGFKWPPADLPHWRFVNPPLPSLPGFTFPRNTPWPHWEFVQPPIAAGSLWPPRDLPLPRWHFVVPPVPAKPAAAAAPAA